MPFRSHQSTTIKHFLPLHRLMLLSTLSTNWVTRNLSGTCLPHGKDFRQKESDTTYSRKEESYSYCDHEYTVYQADHLSLTKEEYLAKVAKHQRYLAGEQGSDPDSPTPKPTKATKKSKPSVPKADLRPPVIKSASSQQPEPKPAPTKSQGKKRKLVTEISDKASPARKSRPGLVSKQHKPISSLRLVDESVTEGIPEKEPRVDDEEADVHRALEESLKSIYDAPRGSLPPVVIREPEYGKYQWLPEVQGKGKEKVTDEHVARDLLTPQTPKKKSHADQYIFQRRTSIPTGSSGHDESSSLYAELGLTDSEVESGEDVPGIDVGVQGEGQAGPNPDDQDEGQAGPNLGDAAASQPLPSPVVYVGPNLEHIDLEVTDVSTQPHPKQMDEGNLVFSTTPYKRPQLYDLFFNDKPSEADNEKTTVETEAETIVSATIQQDTSSIPPMTTPVIDLISRPESPNVHQPLQATATETTTTTNIHHHLNHNKAPQIPSLEKSMNRDHSEELLKDLAAACKKKKKRRDSPKMPPGSPPHQPTPPLPPSGPSGASGSPGASGSSQVPPPLPPPPSTNQEGRSHGSTALSSSKMTTSAEYKAWTTTNTRLGLSVSSTHEDLQIDDDMAPDAQAQSSDDEDIGNANIPKVNLRQDWWKPIEEDRPAIPEPAWSIPSSDVPVPKNNWASVLASTYSPPPENSVLAQTGDMAMFMDWFCKRQGITKLKPQDLKGLAFELVKVFHPNVIHLYKPLPLGGPPGQVTIQSDFFFNKDLEYLRYDSKGSRPALSISKMKEAYYPDVGLEQMVPDQMWIEEECRQRIKDFQLGIKSYQTQLNLTKPRWDATGFEYKHDYTIDEALDYRVKEFKVNRMNPGLNTRFWTRKGVDRSKEFMFAIQKQLKTRRIFYNLESFVGGRVRDGDYRLLKRTE
nr:hypothetical protein [Tanacetum cinerariifolium]